MSIVLGRIDIFTIFVLPIHEHRTFFHLCLPQFLSRVVWFSEYRFFASLVRFIPRYLTALGAIINGVDSLISLSSVLLLVYRNATDFCALILYPAT